MLLHVCRLRCLLQNNSTMRPSPPTHPSSQPSPQHPQPPPPPHSQMMSTQVSLIQHVHLLTHGESLVPLIYHTASSNTRTCISLCRSLPRHDTRYSILEAFRRHIACSRAIVQSGLELIRYFSKSYFES